MKRNFSQEISRILEPVRAYPGVAYKIILLMMMRGTRAGALAYILRETTNAYARSPSEGHAWIIMFAILFACYQAFNRRIQRSNPFRFAFASMVLKYCHETYLKQFFHLDQSHIEKLGTGKLISIIDKGIGTRSDQLDLYVRRIPDFALQLIVGTVVAGLTHRSYGVGFFLFSALTIAIFWTTHNSGQKRRKQRMELQNERTRTFVGLLMNKLEIMQAHKEQSEISKLKQLEDDIQLVNHHKNKASHAAYVVINVMVMILRIIVYVIIGAGIASGGYSIGELVAGLTIVATLDSIMNDLYKIQTGRAFTLDATRQMRDFFDETPLMQSGQDLPGFVFGQGNINLTQITFGYERKSIFQGFDVTLVPKKVYALVGPSGGGKSTLMKLIAGLLRPDSGQILIDEQDIHQHDLASYYRHIGYLTQEPSVFDGTVRENLMYGMVGAINDRLDETGEGYDTSGNTKSVSLQDIIQKSQCQFVYDLPNGLDTEIGERGVRLSGGQRQRLAIAKIMLKNPKIILLDEPTSALDSVSEELVSQAMQELFKDRTVVIIAHRLQTVKHADRILYIDNGVIIEQGTHDELIAFDGQYNKMVEVQTGF